MQEEIGSYDAKTKLPEILRRVEKGENFTITNRGKTVADLWHLEPANVLLAAERRRDVPEGFQSDTCTGKGIATEQL